MTGLHFLVQKPTALAFVGRAMILGCLMYSLNAGAHLFLTTETLNDALAQIGAWHDAVDDRPGGAAAHEPLYRLGQAAWELAELMNEEVRTHGLGQQSLMTEGIERAEAFGVNIAWSENHRRFFYDGSAFRRYVLLAPKGPFAADSNYRLIELDFYLGPTDDIEALESRAINKSEFLDLYPNFPARARVGIFLGIDYRDLYRLCIQRGDADCEARYANLAIEQFRKVGAEHAGSDSGDLATGLLDRTRSEIESQR